MQLLAETVSTMPIGTLHWRIGILRELCKVQVHPVAHKDDCRVAIPWMMASVAPWQHQWHATRLFWDMNLGIFRYPKFLGSSLFPKPYSSVSYQTHVSNRHLFSQSCPDAASFVCNWKSYCSWGSQGKNFQMFKLDLGNAEESEMKLPTLLDHRKESSRKTPTLCYMDYAKAFNCVDHNKLWKILK